MTDSRTTSGLPLTPVNVPVNSPADTSVEQQLREMNEALMVSAVRQHALAEEARRAQAAMVDSETRYRRLFETAMDGILILDAQTGVITDANKIMAELVGREAGELIGKQLHEIGMFKDAAENDEARSELEREEYLRRDHFVVTARDGRSVEVEFVANV